MKAIRWVAEIMVEKGWKNLEWTSDALAIVKDIRDVADPYKCSTRFDMLKIRSLF